MNECDVVVIGAGAAGCFAAIRIAELNPNLRVVILERGLKPLAKVKISGGGRCNVTNVVSNPNELSENYPRGNRFLKKAFYSFSSADMIAWLKKRGIELKEYPDGCLFPETNDSQTIIDCFLYEMKRLNVELLLQHRVDELFQKNEKWQITTDQGGFSAENVVLTLGGQPKQSGFDLLKSVDIQFVSPVPSLFTFNMPKEPIKELMGVVIEHARVKIAGEKWSTTGPLLVTHWGMSGPAVLKCSAFGARILADKGYKSLILVNWTGIEKGVEVAEKVKSEVNSMKKIVNTPLFGIKSRLWEFLIEKAGFSLEARWSDLKEKSILRLTEILTNDTYQMEGKTTFKEEFVTAGGIDLQEINVQTMEAKRFPGLFFAGEVMDIDGVTGGFNFQAAWTTSFIAGTAIANRYA